METCVHYFPEEKLEILKKTIWVKDPFAAET
jgi:hypothetical protein